MLVTVPYHTRSAEPLYERYSPRLPTLIWGHALVQKRLHAAHAARGRTARRRRRAAVIADGAALAFTIGRPRRSEYPVYFPGLRAVAFGDAVVGAQGGLRVWSHELGHRPGLVPRRLRAHSSPLLAAHDIDYVLITHGPPTLRTGGERSKRASPRRR